MRDMKKLIEQHVMDQLVEAELDFSLTELATYTEHFMEEFFDQRKLGTSYGTTPEEALRFMVEGYLEDTFGIEDERRGA